jgi:hypothetical protein
MAGDQPDKVQREIEELLGRLDNFVPEERLAAKIKRRRREKQEAQGPSMIERAFDRVASITMAQVMIGGLALLVISWIFRDPLGGWASWVGWLGLGLTVVAFVLSMVRGRGPKSTLGGRVQRRWRGQIIEYGEPSAMDKMRGWFRRRGRN